MLKQKFIIFRETTNWFEIQAINFSNTSLTICHNYYYVKINALPNFFRLLMWKYSKFRLNITFFWKSTCNTFWKCFRKPSRIIEKLRRTWKNHLPQPTYCQRAVKKFFIIIVPLFCTHTLVDRWKYYRCHLKNSRRDESKLTIMTILSSSIDKLKEEKNYHLSL